MTSLVPGDLIVSALEPKSVAIVICVCRGDGFVDVLCCDKPRIRRVASNMVVLFSRVVGDRD